METPCKECMAGPIREVRELKVRFRPGWTTAAASPSGEGEAGIHGGHRATSTSCAGGAGHGVRAPGPNLVLRSDISFVQAALGIDRSPALTGRNSGYPKGTQCARSFPCVAGLPIPGSSATRPVVEGRWSHPRTFPRSQKSFCGNLRSSTTKAMKRSRTFSARQGKPWELSCGIHYGFCRWTLCLGLGVGRVATAAGALCRII